MECCVWKRFMIASYLLHFKLWGKIIYYYIFSTYHVFNKIPKSGTDLLTESTLNSRLGQLSQKRAWLRRGWKFISHLHATPSFSHWCLMRWSFHHALGRLVMTQQPAGGKGYNQRAPDSKAFLYMGLITHNLPRSSLQALRFSVSMHSICHLHF